MKVFAWAADKQGPGYYRLGLPYEQLRHQYDDLDTLVDTTILLKDVRDCDVIVGQRTVKWASSVWWQSNAKDGRCLVYELDDDLWDLHPSNSAYDHWQTAGIRECLTRNTEVAAAVTVSTPHLAEVVSVMRPKDDPQVYVLPNYVDESLLTYDRPRRDKLTIGWSGSQTHLVDFERAAAPLRRYFQKYPATDMHFMGSNYSHLIKKRLPRITMWKKGVPAFQRSIDFDIGIAPLGGHRFNLSKSPIRALEYAALGIPIVASDVGPYRDFVQHGVTGFLCRTDEDWWKALRALTEDTQMREQMGANGRIQAADHTIQGNAWRWKDAYERILTGRPEPKPMRDFEFDIGDGPIPEDVPADGYCEVSA